MYNYEQHFLQRPFEAFQREIPPLFDNIGIVYSVTENPNKLAADEDWVAGLGIIRGAESLPVRAKTVLGEEPDWTDAMRVADDKVGGVVESLHGQAGPQALVVASDVVFWINGVPKHNLSRNEVISGKLLHDEIEYLIKEFSRPAEVWWDVAKAVGRKGVRAMTGERMAVVFNPIDPAIILEAFNNDIPGALGRNSRLPLIDDLKFNSQIVAAARTPLRGMVTGAGELREWHHISSQSILGDQHNHPFSAADLLEFKHQIVGGIVSPAKLKELERITPCQSRGLVVV